jgi:hypothetical protein
MKQQCKTAGDTISAAVGGDVLWDTNAYRVSGNRNLLEIIDNSPPVAYTYMGHILRIVYTFYLKKDKTHEFTKMFEVRRNQDRMLKD